MREGMVYFGQRARLESVVEESGLRAHNDFVYLELLAVVTANRDIGEDALHPPAAISTSDLSRLKTR